MRKKSHRHRCHCLACHCSIRSLYINGFKNHPIMQSLDYIRYISWRRFDPYTYVIFIVLISNSWNREENPSRRWMLTREPVFLYVLNTYVYVRVSTSLRIIRCTSYEYVYVANIDCNCEQRMWRDRRIFMVLYGLALDIDKRRRRRLMYEVKWYHFAIVC